VKKKGQLPPIESKPNTDDILNAILPPREWIENGYIKKEFIIFNMYLISLHPVKMLKL